MKYRYSNYEETENDSETGKITTFMICTACGKRAHSNFGFEISYAMPGTSGEGKHGYCNACSRKIIPILDKTIEEIFQADEQIRNGESEK